MVILLFSGDVRFDEGDKNILSHIPGIKTGFSLYRFFRCRIYARSSISLPNTNTLHILKMSGAKHNWLRLCWVISNPAGAL